MRRKIGQMINSKTVSALEAILFACGDPVTEDRTAEALGVKVNEIKDIAAALNSKYDESESSLRVLHLGDSWQLTVKPEFMEYARNAAESRRYTPLSNAAMEALTVVAYNQPVTKAFVEHVRGVDSSGVMNSLAEKNLIEEAGRLDLPGKPIAYKTTAAFLRSFGLESLDDLPELPSKPRLSAEEEPPDDLEEITE